jgi:hypothetical protein
MDERRYQELLRIEADLDRGVTPFEAAVRNMSIDSRLDAAKTIDYMNYQQDFDDNVWRPWAAFYNGFVVQGVGGLVGSLQMLRDKNIRQHQENDPNYQENYEATAILDNIKKSSILTPYKIKQEDTADQVIYGLIEGAGQLASQVIVNSLTGGTAGTIYMGAQIAGNQYAELREQGVDSDRAFNAALVNAVIQARLEKTGLDKILEKLPAGSGLKEKALQILGSAVTEGVTEGLQELPEQLTSIWAKNPNMSAREIGREWDENAEANVKDIVFSGVIGGLMGGGASGLKMSISTGLEKYVNKAQVESVEQNAEIIKSSGINPARAAAEIDARNPEAVSVDAAVLKQAYGQTAGELRKVADSLGVTEEQINEAAANGQDIGVTRGNLTATMASVNGFAQTVREHISFDDGASSVNYAEMQKDLSAAYEASEQAAGELDAELDRIVTSAKDAGVAQPQAEGLRTALESRAMIANPTNPAAWLKKHALDFVNAGKKKPGRGLYQQGKLNKDGFYSANITGSEMGSYKDVSDLRNKTVEWYRNNLQGTTAYNPTIGEIRLGKGIPESKIGFNSKGRGKMKVTSAKPEKLLATRYLKELIENNAFVTEADGQKASHQDEHFYYIHGALNINGKRQYIVINVKESADKVLNYYNHNVFNENEYKKIEDALKPTVPTDSSVGQNLNEQSSFANSVSQKGQVYKQQRIVEGKEKTKGMIEPQDDGRYVISLFEGADASTVIHETGHYFFDTFMKDSAEPDADVRMKRDRQRLLEYVGMTEEQWNAADLDGRRAAHERMAEAFETYIMEGKAPSRNLRSLFNRFSKWLKAIYEKHVRSNNAVELTDDVRDVFDHWLAADMDIQQAAKAEGILGKLPDAITKNLSDKNRQWLEDKIMGAKDEAVNMLTKEYMRNFTPERRKAIAEFKAQITPDIEKQVAEERVNRARDAVADMFAKYPKRVVKDKEFYEVERNGRTFLVSKDRKEEVMLAANPKTIAWKYKHILGHTYYNYADRLAAVEKEIDDMLEPIVDQLKEGYGHGIEEFWIDVETGKEADVSDLGEEKRTGHQYKKLRHSLNAPWYQNWYKDKKHTPTKKELRELAYDLYTGVDKYGYYGDINLFGSAQEAAEFKRMSAEQKAEIDELISLRDAIKANPELVEMSKKRALSDEDRVSFELIADEMGYDSGDAMADAIINEPSAWQMVRGRVEQAVKAKFPDAAKERELAEAATMEALYNDESGMVIALEQQLIEDAAYDVAAKDRSSKAREALAVARKAQTEREATAAMAKMPMSEALKASKFAMAERRAAANAQKAIKKGNMEEAAEYKRQQAISHAMVRKSVKLKQEVERNRKFIRKLRTMKKENFGTEQHLNQIGAFLARMGLVRRDYNPTNRTQTLREYLAEMREKLGDMVVSTDDSWLPFVLDEGYDLRDSNNMSIEEYGEVVKMLKQLRNIAKQDTQVELEGKAIFAKENKEIVLAELDKMDTVYEPAPGEADKSSWLKRLSWERLNADSLFEKMDGWKRGFFSKAWYGLLKHCADHEATLTMDWQERDAAAKSAWLPDRKARKAAAEKRHYDELGASADKFTLVQMLCNLGNEGNARRICETPPLGFEQSRLWVRPNAQISADEAYKQTRENLLAFLGKALTKADIEYAQAKIDNCNKYWKQLEEVNLRTKGFAPERVEATPTVLTLANGETVAFSGGYFPLVRDGRNGSRPQNMNALAATDENPAGNISTMTTNSGSSKVRTGARYPVSLTADAEMITMRNTIHDICYREAMIYFRKNINDPEIFAKLKSKMGVEGMRVFREMLEKCANPYSNAGMDFAEDTVARAANLLRRKTVNAIIALNFKIALPNFGNVFLYGNTVDGFTYSDVLTTIPDMLNLTPAHYRQNRAIVFAKSPFMRERAKLPDVTLRDIQATGRLSNLEQWGLDWGAALLERTDNLTAIPIWLKAYNKQIKQGASEQAAVDFADTVIRRTLGSSRVQDVASIQRGGPMYKLFTAFQGFFNTQFNQWYREAHIDAKLVSKGEYWEALKRASTFLLSKYLLACLANVFLGGDGDPLEEDKKGWKKITKELMTYPISVAGGPEGVIANAIVQKAFDMENYGYRMSIVQNSIEKGISFGYNAGRVIRDEAEADALYEPAAEILSITLGLPLQFIRTGGNVVDIFKNDMEFELQDIIRRRPKSER